jgi:hypothetical protein
VTSATRLATSFWKRPIEARRLWIQAVAIEMTRVRSEPAVADPELGRRLQCQIDLSGILANRVVRRAGRRILESMGPDSKSKQ